LNFLTNSLDRRLPLKPADHVMVYGCVSGKHACVNLTRVSPLMGLGVRQAKWSNMRKHVLTINMFLYHLIFTLLTS